MNLSVEYALVGTGWAKCTLESDDSRCEITASYLSNALARLLIAAASLVAGFKTVSFGFDEEPGEYRWVIEAVDLNLCSLEILEFPELNGNRPKSEGRLLFSAKLRPVVFGNAVLAAAQELLAKHGESGYEERWSEHSFPSLQLSMLENEIKNAGNAV